MPFWRHPGCCARGRARRKSHQGDGLRRCRSREPGSCHSGHRVQDRVRQQAIHRHGDHAPCAGRQAHGRRSRREVLHRCAGFVAADHCSPFLDAHVWRAARGTGVRPPESAGRQHRDQLRVRPAARVSHGLEVPILQPLLLRARGHHRARIGAALGRLFDRASLPPGRHDRHARDHHDGHRASSCPRLLVERRPLSERPGVSGRAAERGISVQCARFGPLGGSAQPGPSPHQGEPRADVHGHAPHRRQHVSVRLRLGSQSAPWPPARAPRRLPPGVPRGDGALSR